MPNESKPAQVHSVAKAMELIEALLKRRAPMTLQELSAAVGYPKSTIHGLLSTLRDYGMVAQNPDGRYALGVRLFECGCAVSEGWDVSKVARPYLEQLSAKADGSSFLSIMEGNHVISFDQCTGSGGVQVIPEIGSRLPLHATSQGKLLLSYLSHGEARKRLLEAGLPPYTPHTITDVNSLLDGMQWVRDRGYAVEDGEYKVGLRSVSAPVRDSLGAVRYAIGVVGLFRRVQSEEFQSAIEETVATADALSKALGWNGK